MKTRSSGGVHSHPKRPLSSVTLSPFPTEPDVACAHDRLVRKQSDYAIAVEYLISFGCGSDDKIRYHWSIDGLVCIGRWAISVFGKIA